MLRSPSAHTYVNLFEPFHFFTDGDQLVVPIGVTHISLALHQIQSREQEGKKEQILGVNSSAERELCNTEFPVYICRLTRAWISSETSTKQMECRLILTRSSFTGLDPLSCRLASLLRCPVSTASIRPPSPTAHFSVPLSPSLTGVPSPLLVMSRSRVQNPLSGFAPKQTKESSAWQTTYIVLHI